jgi:hypothetical protein
VPATVRASQHHRDVVIAAALLPPEIGAADRCRVGAIPQAGEPEEVLEEVPMGADAEVPLAHRFECSHLLDAVRVEVLELQPIREQHPTDEPAGGDREAAFMEGHERHHIPLGAATQTRCREPSTRRCW